MVLYVICLVTCDRYIWRKACVICHNKNFIEFYLLCDEHVDYNLHTFMIAL